MSRLTKSYIKGVKVSERHGAGEWNAERLSAVILIPLTIWALWSGWIMSGAGYEGVMAWFGNPLNAGLLAVTLLGLIGLVCVVLAAAGVFFIVRLALGSAPLPAGFGA